MQAIVQNLPRAVANGQDEAARTMMAYAENVAGMAFSNAGLGMVPCDGTRAGRNTYKPAHGVCNAVLLHYVLAFNSTQPGGVSGAVHDLLPLHGPAGHLSRDTAARQ